MSDQNTQNQENQQQDAGKDHKKFLDGLSKMMAILNGDESLFKNKVPNGQVPTLIEKLTRERREKAELEFITKASALIDKKVQFDKDCTQKRREFEKSIADKEKEFLKEMNDVFGLIDNMGELQKNYATTLRNLGATAEIAIAPAPNTEETPNS